MVLETEGEVNPDNGALYDVIKCNCRFFISHDLYCRHIFAILNLLQVKSLERYLAIGHRWTKDYMELVMP